MVSGAWNLALDLLIHRRSDPGSQHLQMALLEIQKDLYDLFTRFSLGKNYLWNTRSQSTMMIKVRKTVQRLVRKLPKLFHYLVNGAISLTLFF